MRATDIQAGDLFEPGPEGTNYKVLEVDRTTNDKGTEFVRALVEFADGGTEHRHWWPTDDVPWMVHPS